MVFIRIIIVLVIAFVAIIYICRESLAKELRKKSNKRNNRPNNKRYRTRTDKRNKSIIKKILNILNNINGYPLDDYQSRVVLSNELATLVVAGAGSGKSLTIIGKIVYLVKICNIDPKDILCISFTNDATINLKNNIKKNYDLDLDIYTFHKLSLEILKQNNRLQDLICKKTVWS